MAAADQLDRHTIMTEDVILGAQGRERRDVDGKPRNARAHASNAVFYGDKAIDRSP